ncbi:MAG: hypothetical protein RMJ82_04595 [Gemmatales bacterium]|nr:hypothetical protein [Gemmatales bacterium]
MQNLLWGLMACSLGMTVLAVYAQDENKIQVRSLDLSRVKLNPREAELSRLDMPVVITDAEGLAEAFPDKGSQEAIAGQVDFRKEKLLFFRWAGSGGDRLTPKVQRGKENIVVVFHLSPGLTDDLRRHFYLFALPRGVKWKVAAPQYR